MIKKALIFGVTGQDGSYLADLLIKKKYKVHGVKRRSSSFNTSRIDHLYQDPQKMNRNFILHYGDVTDSFSVNNIISKVKPDEIYNLAAQSHVAVSFEVPEYTANADAIGALRILEAIRLNGLEKKTKFYQAGTSEMFGKVQSVPQNEKTSFYPRSPYGVAKLYAHWVTVNYRESYKIFACNGILFNHESPLRGETFVTKKIVNALCKIKKNKQSILYLGNLDAKRDWGHAKDYVVAMWKMLQNKKPKDYVIATGKQYSVKDFVNLVLNELKIKFVWKGSGTDSKCFDKNSGKCIVQCDKKYFRPLEVDTLLGDSKKARAELKWKPKYNIKMLVKEMVLKENL
ncbi:GDP-mannose 4,6-dehydratase [Pelagibacterales bacterium SAG-MED21]|nr:GDP-mannose 4,6-dehydratase [Pelagibacterales bacterium SAG-MED21]